MTRKHALSAITLAAVAAFLGGCTANDTTFGGAVRTNVALQVINPDPTPHDEALPGGSGDRSAMAAEHYRKGTVKQPVSIQTTSKSTAGGSGPN